MNPSVAQGCRGRAHWFRLGPNADLADRLRRPPDRLGKWGREIHLVSRSPIPTRYYRMKAKVRPALASGAGVVSILRQHQLESSWGGGGPHHPVGSRIRRFCDRGAHPADPAVPGRALA